jgi:hypothetical protein
VFFAWERKEETHTMPLYLDHHKNVEGLTAEAIHDAHMKDLEAQQEHGVNYIRY